MKIICLTFFVIAFTVIGFGQKTKVYGKIIDGKTKQPIDFAKVAFKDSDVSVFSEEDGSYSIETYYASDTLVVSIFGYKIFKQKIALDKTQEINVSLEISEDELETVVVKATGDSPAMRIMKRVIRNKPINNKEKLLAYDYELYTKVQVDLNNIGNELTGTKAVKKLDFILDYLDSSDKEGVVLPMLLSESVSDFSYKKNPVLKKEITKATRLSGFDNLQVNQLLGDVYMDINIYDNYIDLFQRAFISPVSNYGKSFYNYSLVDSAYIDNHFYFKIDFKPKRDGDATFVGTMWIHDTTYAIKEFKADLNAVANVNFINGMYIEQYFDQVQDEVWMMTSEKLIIDLQVTKDSKLPGMYMRKSSERYNFVINEVHPDDFYKTKSTVEILDGANDRSLRYWDSIRPVSLSEKEKNIDVMIDSLNHNKTFNTYKNFIIFASTGYWVVKKIEIGDLYSLASTNPVEKFRTNIALRTSNNFSKRIELGGFLGYGFKDEKIKGGGLIRINLTPKKRGMLNLYANSDLEQYGSGSSVGNTFSNFLRTAPFDKLFYVNKLGMSLEKDLGKDFILNFSAENRQVRSLGALQFERLAGNNQLEPMNTLKTTEFTIGASWGKERQFITAVFNRATLGSRYPILSLEATFGVKGILGSQYTYQRLHFSLDHTRNTGAIGRISYGVSFGKYFGTVAYPFLKIHEGSQTYWYLKNAFNKMSYFEFISDTYVNAYIEHHFQGLILNRVPGIKKLHWRLVAHGKATWGMLSSRQNDAILLPSISKTFGDTPYVEVGVGIENIFKFFRVDFIYRATHHIQGVSPFGVRARFDIVI